MNTENKFNYVLVGGTFNDNKGKESGVVNKLYHALGTFNSVMYNGGNYFDLVGNALSSITETDLIIWMADVDNAKEVSKKYGIMSVPTLLIFEDGEVKNSSLGFLSEDEVKEFLDI